MPCIQFKLDISGFKQSAYAFVNTIPCAKRIKSGHSMLISGAIKLIFSVEQVEQITLTDKKFFAVGLDCLAGLDDMIIEKDKLPY